MGKKREQKKAVEDASEDQAAQKPKVTNKNTAGKQAAAKSSNEDDNNAEKKPKTKKNRENDPFATENLPFKPPTMHAVDYYRRDQRKAAEQKFPEMKRRDVAKYLKKQYSGESPEVKQVRYTFFAIFIINIMHLFIAEIHGHGKACLG